MYKILKREEYSPTTYMWEVEAPDVAKSAQPGHFVMVKHSEQGERIPLTVADFDREKGTITLVIQAVGKSTQMYQKLKEGDYLDNFVGPLGIESHLGKKEGKVVCIGGGLGVAPVFPQLRKLKEEGNHTISIVGFRSKDLILWQDKFEKYSDELLIATDDGSYGTKGFVTTVLEKVLAENDDIAEVIAIGPLVMMKACCEMTRPKGIKTMVSLNPIMVDGTGMCGCCRVTIDGKMKFACVDGPDFDGHATDFDELLARHNRFARFEKESIDKWDGTCACGAREAAKGGSK
ncbi:MAG: sulfide/dihydroorotate dehydrogenase-like FAD/NAD-binding protein [Proteobacteria bacterium]|nr:sulfide/dihydroorotate dehydrogenase-like FAD/NAD-binding protein [Pseudomonadota bacterium]